eukprot:9025188-Lingulodinium_polyedra.AAC.1
MAHCKNGRSRVWCLLCCCFATVDHFRAKFHLLREAEEELGCSLGFRDTLGQIGLASISPAASPRAERALTTPGKGTD